MVSSIVFLNDEEEEIWKGTVVIYFKVSSRNICGEN
jgi:hypothetical protein